METKNDKPTLASTPEASPRSSATPAPRLPLFEVARRLGDPWWSRVEGQGFHGKPVVLQDGPGWLLAAVMAGARLDEHALTTEAELRGLGEEAKAVSIGVHSGKGK